MGYAGLDVLNTHNGDIPEVQNKDFQDTPPKDNEFLNKAWPNAVDTTNYGIKAEAKKWEIFRL